MKGKQTVKDMILSMAAIGIVVAGIYVFIPHDDTEKPPEAISYGVELSTARRAASYPVAAPVGLPDDWRATTVRYKGAENERWHLGFYTPDGKYVGVEQSVDQPERFIKEATQNAEATKITQTINGEPWKRYEGERYDALVRQDGDATTVVTGSASIGQLSKVAAALETAAPEDEEQGQADQAS
ncbi:DUF4245 domain-containing protein [Streptomyces albidoflavus]|uniref:DUF4245 domain-containing protein n=1 Tax=Streptomyces albidoflavus TaxID=1886 RepID=UPI00386A29F3|nr:DUF4245 domain-containing protein [Streptomyces albidoflavus]